MIHIVTGGSGSGKSAFAEDLIVGFSGERRLYIATMYPFDKESRSRIARHQRMRAGKGFETAECYTGLSKLAPAPGTDVLLECMSNLVANEMYQQDGAGEQTYEEICRGVRALADRAENLVVVTNEVFSDGIVYDGQTEQYLKNLGRINRYLGAIADRVTEVVYGIPVRIK